MKENERPHDMQMISSSQWLTFFADLSRYQGQLVSLEIDEDLLADDPTSGKAPLLRVEYDKHKGVTISTGSGTAAQTYTVKTPDLVWAIHDEHGRLLAVETIGRDGRKLILRLGLQREA